MQLVQAEVTKKVSSTQELGHQASARLGGYAAIGGCLTMITGAVLGVTSGTDLWGALDSGDMAGYLEAVGGVQAHLVTNLTIWILGVFILGVAGTIMVAICQQRPLWAQIAHACYRTAVPLVIVSYLAMLALVMQLGGETSATAVAIAEVVGWIGARADDLATALMIGFGPLFIALAGRGEWVPTWLLRWGYLTGIVGLFSLVTLYLPGMGPYGFLILPVGMGWMIAAGVVLLRRANAAG